MMDGSRLMTRGVHRHPRVLQCSSQHLSSGITKSRFMTTLGCLKVLVQSIHFLLKLDLVIFVLKCGCSFDESEAEVFKSVVSELKISKYQL